MSLYGSNAHPWFNWYYEDSPEAFVTYLCPRRHTIFSFDLSSLQIVPNNWIWQSVRPTWQISSVLLQSDRRVVHHPFRISWCRIAPRGISPFVYFFTVWMPTRAKSTSQASGTISGASPVGFAMGRLQCRPNAIITRGQNCNWGTIIRGSVARTVPLLVTIYWVWSRTKNIRVVMLHWSPPDKNHRAK